MNYLKAALLIFSTSCACLAYAGKNPVPLFSVGGGYYDAGPNHSGRVFQIDYKLGKYYLLNIRPQATLVVPELHSFYLGTGLGIDVYLTKHILLSPSLLAGYYHQGCGRNLGCAFEFREAFEIAYEWAKSFRLNVQYSHISNASIGDHNPGSNALTVLFSVPFVRLY